MTISNSPKSFRINPIGVFRARKLEKEKKESRMFDKLQRLISEGVELSGNTNWKSADSKVYRKIH